MYEKKITIFIPVSWMKQPIYAVSSDQDLDR